MTKLVARFGSCVLAMLATCSCAGSTDTSWIGDRPSCSEIRSDPQLPRRASACAFGARVGEKVKVSLSDEIRQITLESLMPEIATAQGDQLEFIGGGEAIVLINENGKTLRSFDVYVENTTDELPLGISIEPVERTKSRKFETHRVHEIAVGQTVTLRVEAALESGRTVDITGDAGIEYSSTRPEDIQIDARGRVTVLQRPIGNDPGFVVFVKYKELHSAAFFDVVNAPTN